MNNVTKLHYEINEFCQLMAPTPKEDEMRRSVVDKVREVVAGKWANAKVEVYGSFSTGFHLPTSDIDLVIIGSDWIKPPLHELEEELLAAHICSPDKVQVIDKASVPIVKFTHQKTGIKVDISFNMESGLKSIELIKKYSLMYPPLKKLVIVLKQYLLEKKLNEVFYGGISSYSLILLVISFLQLHLRIDARYSNCNLAILLIEFFELYGCQFNYIKTAISIKGDGTYMSKDKVELDYAPSILCIEDPLTPGNDIGRGCYGVMHVKQAFEQAYILLNQISNPLTNIHYSNNKSILGRIIKAVDNGVLDQRKQLHESNFYFQYGIYATQNSSLSSGSSPSDSDCENQSCDQYIYSTLAPHHPLISTPMNTSQVLRESKENLHLTSPVTQTPVLAQTPLGQQRDLVSPRAVEKSIHMTTQQNSAPLQLRENTLLQNQQQAVKDTTLLTPISANQYHHSKENVVAMTTSTPNQKENILLMSPAAGNLSAKDNSLMSQQNQQKENIHNHLPLPLPISNQKENQHQLAHQTNHHQPHHNKQTTKIFHTLPVPSQAHYRYNNIENHNRNNRNKNSDMQYFDDIRLHHYTASNNNRKYFPTSDEHLALSSSHHSNQHHHNSMPFIHSNSPFHNSMTFENTSRNNNRKNNNMTSSVPSSSAGSVPSNNYHKKAHSFHST